METLRRELPRNRVTLDLVPFMREHPQDKDWKTLKWTRQPDSFLCRVSDKLERERSENDFFHAGYQGFFPVLNDWPDNEFVEDEDRQRHCRVFREEWEAMRATGCIGDNYGDYHNLNHFDYVPDDGDY